MGGAGSRGGVAVTIVAIDTASRSAAWVALTDRAGMVEAAREVSGGELDRRLPAVLLELLPASLDAVVVLTGPGSYTGVRGGMAAALGIASARRVPLHGVSNLTAIAAAFPGEPGAAFLVVTDAGRGGAYCASFATRGEGPVQLTDIERRAVGDLDRVVPMVSTAHFAGLPIRLVMPLDALAAAVPLALAAPPLAEAGLSATHAVGVAASPGPATNP
jgi:tRNA threonylcarbamoyl adenosine modification protein YeaZ